MRIKNQILYGIEIIIAVYCFFLATIVMKKCPDISIYINILFFATMMMVAISFFAPKTHKKNVDSLVLKTIIVDNLIYYLILLVSGLFLGFVQNAYSLLPLDMLSNILPVVILIGCKELFRQIMVKNLRKEKLSLIVFVLEIITLSLISNMSLLSTVSGAVFFKSLGLLILPTIAEELLLTYLAYNTNYKITIIYSLFQKLWIYITPIIPDFSDYIRSIIYLVFPTIVFIQANRYLLKYDKSKLKTTSSKTELYFTIPIVILVAILVILISGITKYQIVSVATGSMEPNISRGDAVIIRKLTQNEKEKLKEGQVIAFVHDNNVVLHRIVEIEESKIFDSFTIQTKGDANKEEDPYELSSRDILGTVNVKVPWIGYPTLWFNGE